MGLRRGSVLGQHGIDCGNSIDTHGQYVVDYGIIILEERDDDEAD